jgi:hypothetical protein
MRMFLTNDESAAMPEDAPLSTAPFPAATTPARRAAPRLVPSDVDQLLWLPDSIVRGLAEDFVATLPANVQRVVRARRAG